VSFRRLLVSDVTVQTRTVTASADAYGQPVVSWVPTTYPKACWLEETESVEIIVGRDTVISQWEATLGLEVVVGPLDRLQVSGFASLFEVVGDPIPAPTPRGVHHFAARLRSIEG